MLSRIPRSPRFAVVGSRQDGARVVNKSNCSAGFVGRRGRLIPERRFQVGVEGYVLRNRRAQGPQRQMEADNRTAINLAGFGTLWVAARGLGQEFQVHSSHVINAVYIKFILLP